MKMAHTGEGPEQEDAVLRMQCTALCCTALQVNVCCARGARLISTRASAVVVQAVVSSPSFHHHSFPREKDVGVYQMRFANPHSPPYRLVRAEF